jgi:tetratricopeptide (TPR) repeat protein
MESQTFTIAPDAFDVTLLPSEARTPGTAVFREAVNAFLQEAFRGFGGRATIFVDDRRIAVSWNPDPTPSDPLEVIAGKLREGRTAEGIQLLQFLLSRQPDDVNILYNLGMALSDAGRLDEAVTHLRRAVELAPAFANGLVALGVALSRQQKNPEAVEVLAAAAKLEPDNPWAARNLGIGLLQLSKFGDAATHLRRAVILQADDQQSWAALGDALRLSGSAKEAEKAYGRAIALNPHNDLAEIARRGSSQMAHTTFASKIGGAARPDAVQYCLAALKTYAPLPKAEVQKIAFEIAVVGREGFDVNKAEKRYRLKSMEGEYTGLQMVCYMYVGFQIVAPGTDIGFDLSREYNTARSML